MTQHSKVIAVDFDDTLSYTNRTICQWHNDKYGTKMSLDDFHSYYYWKNPGWGTPTEAISKVHAFLSSPHVNEIPPIEGAQTRDETSQGCWLQTRRDYGTHAENRG
jgi:hypothetical protein